MRLIAEFDILGAPDLPNKSRYSHWAIRSKAFKRWKNLVVLVCEKNELDNLQLNTAVLTFTRHSSRECDFDNLVSSFKPVQDGLVFAGVIADDRPINIGQPKYEWKFRPRKDGEMITIKIETKEMDRCP